MESLYIVRTATLVSLAAAAIGVGWLGMQGDEVQITPEMVAVAIGPAEPVPGYFPAGFALQADAEEGQVYEYY